MGLLSFFTNSSPEAVYQKLAKDVVFFALYHRSRFGETNPRLTADASAEIVYLLLHLVDQHAFKILGPTKRNEVFDRVAELAIYEYSSSLFKKSTTSNVVDTHVRIMYNNLDQRQVTYSYCKTLTGDPWPSRGTKIFACSYFTHKALERTDRADVDAVLRGEQDVSEDNMDAFPDMDDILIFAQSIIGYIEKSRIPQRLNRL